MADFYRIMRPLLFALPPEFSHRLSIKALQAGLAGFVPRVDDPPSLNTSLWGLKFSNPLGMAAGFDKNAEVPGALLRLGFGFTETGTVTPLPQQGNNKPRLFRLKEDRAIINRLGFNNQGLEKVAARLERLSAARAGPIGVNIGANKISSDRIEDYAVGFSRLLGLADYFVINVSSPNTPGLRELQSKSALTDILQRTRAVLREKLPHGKDQRPPVLVKVAPDLTSKEQEEIAELALGGDIDGLVISNTTIARAPGLGSAHRDQAGGLSGQPLFELSTAALADFYRLTKGAVPLIGVGGISSGRDAYRKIRAGATLLQLYTALIYQGPGLLSRIKTELADCLEADGFKKIGDAVGADHLT